MISSLRNGETVSEKDVRLLVAGGGTGGHVFPGIAIAEAVEGLIGGRARIMWIGTGRAVERAALKSRRWDYHVLDVRPLYGSGYSGAFFSLAALPLSIFKALLCLRKFSPDIVLGIGGYVSGPVIAAAWILGLNIAIQEQNLYPGLANRWAARLAKTIFTSFSASESKFPPKMAGKIVCAGNPVRLSVLETGSRDVEKKKERQIDVPSILILGGSQGATGLNRLAASALQSLVKSGVHFRAVHQAGADRLSDIEPFYSDIKDVVTPVEFIDDMGSAYREADVVVCRAGATTLAEITALGKASILIPYPHAADSHQDANAAFMSEKSAAIYLRQEDTGAVRLANEIDKLLKNRNRLVSMEDNASRLGKPGAASSIAKKLLKSCDKTR